MENTENKALAIVDEDTGMIGLLTSKKSSFCSFKPKTEAEQKLLFNVTNSPDKRVKEMVNLTINVKDVSLLPLYHRKRAKLANFPAWF